MTHTYLTSESPDAFLDCVEKAYPKELHPDWTEKCPTCKGHGGWNLRLNAYSNRDEYGRVTSYSHFKAHCNSCNGWGWGSTCSHKWDGKWEDSNAYDKKGVGPPKVGKCEAVWVCSKCGIHRVIDSSD